MNEKERAVFIDRDGVINYTVYRGENFWVAGKKVCWTAPYSYSEFRIRPRVTEALDLAGVLGFKRILVTNQPDRAYGLISDGDYDQIMHGIRRLPLDDIFVCPHRRDEGCLCRKPKSGLLMEAARKWNIDLPASYMIGDAEIDMLAGRSAGCTTILVSTNYNSNVENLWRRESLWDAMRLIEIMERVKREME